MFREIIKGETSEILRQKAQIVEKINQKVLSVLEDMLDTLKHTGGNGLSAPQIGVPLRLIVIKIEMNYIKLINPVIAKSAGEQVSLEGCLSLPGIYGKIKRPEFILTKAMESSGVQITVQALYRHAAVFAHEIDHLDGILMIDKAFQIGTYR